MDTDGNGNEYVDVGNIRVTYVNAADRKKGEDSELHLPNAPVLRLRAYSEPGKSRKLHHGADYHLNSDEAVEKLINAIRQVCADRRAAQNT